MCLFFQRSDLAGALAPIALALGIVLMFLGRKTEDDPADRLKR